MLAERKSRWTAEGGSAEMNSEYMNNGGDGLRCSQKHVMRTLVRADENCYRRGARIAVREHRAMGGRGECG